jgi:thiol-disulfide isomerase/thioredoxin
MRTNLYSFFAGCFMLASATTYSQTTVSTTPEVKITPEFPTAKDVLKISFKPSANTKINNDDSLICQIRLHYLPQYGQRRMQSRTLKASNGIWSDSIKLNDSLQLLTYNIGIEEPIERGRKIIWLSRNHILVYTKGKKPVPGALAQSALIISEENGYSKEADSLFRLEIKNNPKSSKDIQVLSNHYFSVADNPSYVAKKDSLYKEILSSLKRKENQTDAGYNTASNVFKQAGQKAQRDSITALAIQKYPKGLLAKFDHFNRLGTAKDSASVMAVYLEFVSKFSKKDPLYSGIVNQAAGRFESFSDALLPQEFINEITHPSIKASILNNVAWQKATKGKLLDSALSYSKLSLDLLDQIRKSLPVNASKNQIEGLNEEASMYTDTYAYILYKQGKYKEAAKYQQVAYEIVEKPSTAIKEHYALFLQKSGDLTKAKTLTEEIVKEGKINKETREILKNIYTQEHPQSADFDTYLKDLNTQGDAFRREKLAKEMMNEPAPMFTLKSLDGSDVSLADLKGKVVILDFWATWCGPCVRSFPSMAAAQDKFKNDPNVKFLFINTWENKPDAVTKFLEEKKYPFTVLLDNYINGKNTAVNDYKVDGIPSKFIIDKNGVIRFKRVGFEGSTEQVVDEISKMIEMVGK